MILYKTVVMQYGNFLDTGKPCGPNDVLAKFVPPEAARELRKSTLSDIRDAQIYMLDPNAANYLDSLREEVPGVHSEGEGADEIALKKYLSQIEMPRELIWVELDSNQLWRNRERRGITQITEKELENFAGRSFLIDNRIESEMTVRLFCEVTESEFLEPLFSLAVRRTAQGRLDFHEGIKMLPIKTALTAFARSNGPNGAQLTRDLCRELQGQLTYEMVIAFLLFAAMANKDDDLIVSEASSLTKSQEKSARKFGKTWLTDTLRTHIIIRIGPSGEKHLDEQRRRREHLATQSLERAGRREHWVAEHERRYKDGKVVRVRAHKRGTAPNIVMPAHVLGPKVGAFDN